MSWLSRVPVSAIAACVLLAGCGGDQSDQVRAVTADYLEAIASGNPSACELMSERELDRVAAYFKAGDDDPLQTCREGIEVPFNSAAIREAAARIPNAELRVGDDLATVRIDPSSGGGSAPTLISLVREDDAWKVDGSG
jgi:hypothetical protein